MPCSRTALGQLIDRLTGRCSGLEEGPWTVQARTPSRNPIETILLAVIFTCFAWLLAFDLLTPVCPAHVARVLAVPGAFLILQLVPASVGFALDQLVRRFESRRHWDTHWISEEIHFGLATMYAALWRLAPARPICRVWLALVALNVVAFVILRVIKAVTGGNPPHA
jgi:hypothetical protein